MAAVSSVHLQDNIKIQEQSDDEPYSPNTRDTTSPEYQDEKTEERQHTSFSIHNVLKKERDSNSPENVFSTEKLLQNTPNFEENLESTRNSSSSPNLEEHEDTNDYRAEISVDDDNSCCSDDTVLSVGNEAPINESIYENNNDQPPESSQGLTSFKHIQTHLNAISQLSQNLTINQPLLLRPSPITPNPLMFLNQPLLFQNPLVNQDLKSNMNLPTRLPIPQNNLNLNPQPFGLNFGMRMKSQTQELRNTRTDENRRLNYLTPKSPDEARDFMNQNCLKFSIDNILKADFGRRITDPLNKRKTLKSRQFEVKSPVKDVASKPEIEVREPEKLSEKGGAIDLSKGDDSSSNSGSTPGATSGEGPMVWPAWVYCTRYSDRPSSASV
ncbi:homeobox protein invected-like [Pectinophora gossypiella]|uniref:homeobox protein invected-like n=1 Tax=Pectinophora gossypiella TaxID=13191 RepID=UPI00214EEBC6|nr:homeobox protein invected-like [Pectinophora gossypiella]